MDTFKLTSKLKAYKAKIESETLRKVIIEPVPKPYIANGEIFAFRPHHSNISVYYAQYAQITEAEFEYDFAHEMTHGYLLYCLRYHTARRKDYKTDFEGHSVGLISNTIDDIVVHKILQEEGFGAFSPTIYLRTIREETESIPSGAKIYNTVSQNALDRNRFMVLRYIIAWGHTRYCDLEPSSLIIIKKFINVFEKHLPEQHTMAKPIKQLLLDNDIFSVEGHLIILQGALSSWNLKDSVELVQLV